MMRKAAAVNLVLSLAILACDDGVPMVEALPPVKTSTLALAVLEQPLPPTAPTIQAAREPIKTATVAKKAKTKPRIRTVDVEINGALEGALRKAIDGDEAPALAQVVKRVMVWWMNPRKDLRRGDRLRVVYEVPKVGEPIAHAIWLDSEKLGPKAAVRYKKPGAKFHRWYHADGSEVALRLRHSPIDEYQQITSLLRDGRRHRGMDFKAPVGTPLKAPFTAVVKRRNWSTRRNGNCLHLKTSRGMDIFLLHLDKIPKSIRPGVTVKRGQVVAVSGNTGRSFAPHLHYQLEKAGRVLDPLKIHDSYRQKLDAAGTKAVQQELTRLANKVAKATST